MQRPKGISTAEGKAPRLALALAFVMAGAVSPTYGTEADTAPPEAIEIPTSHGFSLPAHRYGRGEHWVIFCHGAVFNKESWAALCREVAQRQATALAFDFHSWREPPFAQIPLSEDILAAVRFARAQGAQRVALVGGSLGADATLRAARSLKQGEVEQYVLLSPSPVPDQPPFPGRKCFVASRGERISPGLKSWARTVDPEAQVVLLPGSAHAQHIFKTERGAELTELILTFLGLEETPKTEAPPQR